MHACTLQSLRHALVPSALDGLGARLLQLLLGLLASWPQAGQLDLVATLKTLVFEASVALLFGPHLLECSERAQSGRQHGSCGSSRGFSSATGPSVAAYTAGGVTGPAAGVGRVSALQRDFELFNEGFELAASPLPAFLQPRFLAARRRLLAALHRTHASGQLVGTVVDALVQACELPAEAIPAMLLAVLWASQANSAPAAFWCLGFLLLPENRRHREAVEAQIQAAVAAAAAAAAGGGGGGEGKGPVGESGRGAVRPPRASAPIGAGGGPSASAVAGASSPTDLPPLLSRTQQRGLLAAAADSRGSLVAAGWEALRLRSPGIDVRIAASDVAMPLGGGKHTLISKVNRWLSLVFCPGLCWGSLTFGALLLTSLGGGGG